VVSRIVKARESYYIVCNKNATINERMYLYILSIIKNSKYCYSKCYNAVKRVLRYRKRISKKEWMTSEILDMIEKRKKKERNVAKRNIQKYN
jgi:hypothetical protein